MGLLGKKDGIVCCKCHVSNDKLAKKYQKAKGPDRTVSFPAGSFKIVDVSKTMDLNEMVQCRDCGAYFCEKCGKGVPELVEVEPNHWVRCYRPGGEDRDN